jgi:hypothetical protein
MRRTSNTFVFAVAVSCLAASCIAQDAAVGDPLKAVFSFNPQGASAFANNAEPPRASATGYSHDGHTPITIYVDFSASVAITQDNFKIFDTLRRRPVVSFSILDESNTQYEFSFVPVPDNQYTFQLFGIPKLEGQRSVHVVYTGGDV